VVSTVVYEIENESGIVAARRTAVTARSLLRLRLYAQTLRAAASKAAHDAGAPAGLGASERLAHGTATAYTGTDHRCHVRSLDAPSSSSDGRARRVCLKSRAAPCGDPWPVPQQ
jgi:hypothetical protein